MPIGDVPVRIGGMSKVWCCTDSKNGNRVAVKVIEGQRLEEGFARTVFEREQNIDLLQHPNIARLHDLGVLEGSGHPFLVFDWIKYDLSQVKSRFVQEGADTFLDLIGLPVLRALCYAHERQVVHRDLKPSNILVNSQGSPLLTDFGISKYRGRQLDSTATVRDWVTKPFAPPETEHSSSYRRDVFGFGVLLLWSLSTFEVVDYPDFSAALGTIDAHPEILKVINECCQLEMGDRPNSAMEVLDRLTTLQSGRLRLNKKKKRVHLGLTNTARQKLVDENSEHPTPEIILEHDHQEATVIRSLTEDPQKPWNHGERQYFLYGTRWRLHLAMKRGEAKGTVVTAKMLGESECDAFRDKCFVAEDFEFCFNPPLNHQESAASLDGILDEVEQWEEVEASEKEGKEGRRLFEEWAGQIDAREAFESQEAERFRFTRSSLEGSRLVLQLTENLSDDLIETPVRVIGQSGRFVCNGVVESTDGDQITVYVSRLPTQLPSTGEVLRDDGASQVQRNRERTFLNAVRYRTPGVLRAELADLIIDPATAGAPRLTAPNELKWAQNLDEAKQDAVQAALGTQDFLLVEGPPGTGKTSFIAELVAQTLLADPTVKILLASQTHAALDNALLRIESLPHNFTSVRLGDPEFKKISEDVLEMTIDRRIDQWRKQVDKESEAYVVAAAESTGVPLDSFRLAIQLRQLAELMDQDSLYRQQIQDRESQIYSSGDRRVDKGPLLTPGDIEDLKAEIGRIKENRKGVKSSIDEISQDKGCRKHLREINGDYDSTMIRDHASDILAKSLESSKMVDLINFQAKWRERVGQGADFDAAVVRSSQIVAATCMGLAGFKGIEEIEFDLCIIDEASKATATESMLPLLRSRRWVLVGDERQLPPFLDPAFLDQSLVEKHGLDVDELGRSIFSRLRAGLPGASKRILTRQHRMVDPVGSLISDCFYNGQIENAGISPDEWVGTSGLFQEHAVCWYSTELLVDKKEKLFKKDMSYRNNCEVQQVRTLLQRLDMVLAGQGYEDEVSVLVLAPYSAQVYALDRSLSSVSFDSPGLRLEVNTVDAAQGREADVIIFSTTRSNQDHQIGFLKDLARANVALSRGKFFLAIVGDASFFDRVESPFKRVLSFIRSNPDISAVEIIQS